MSFKELEATICPGDRFTKRLLDKDLLFYNSITGKEENVCVK